MSLWPPERIRSQYAAWTWTVAWEWPDLATTWRLENSAADAADQATRVVFVKVLTPGHSPTVADESVRMRWAQAYLAVPEVIDEGSHDDGPDDEGSHDRVDWIITGALAGVDASRHSLLAEPTRLVPILARALATFHGAAPVAACPFDFRATTAIAHARRRGRDGISKLTDLHPEHAHLTIPDALRELERLAPRTEDLVVCHGDYCMPNVLLDETGTVTGYVDLGELGVADRWWDVALGAWSTVWNIGPGYEELFYASYGIEPDEERIRFSRLLYDLVS